MEGASLAGAQVRARVCPPNAIFAMDYGESKREKLQSIRVRGYKILRDFALEDIGPLTVIVGPNGCGKSALWEIVNLFQYWAHEYRDCESYHPSTNSDEFKSAFSIDLNFLVGHGEMKYTLKAYPRPSSLYIWEERPGTSQKFIPFSGGNLREYCEKWRAFKPTYTYKLGKSRSLIWDAVVPCQFLWENLSHFMSNLPQVLFTLQDRNRKVFEDINEIILEVMGLDNQECSLKVEKKKNVYDEEYVDVWIEKDGVKSDTRILYDAPWYCQGVKNFHLGDWPEGWKAFLCWLVALRTAPSGGVVFIEELENNLHPHLLARVLDEVRRANQRGVQVFIATHSVELVNLVKPEELVLMNDGKAYRIDQETADKIRGAEIPLGNAWVNGFLNHVTMRG